MSRAPNPSQSPSKIPSDSQSLVSVATVASAASTVSGSIVSRDSVNKSKRRVTFPVLDEKSSMARDILIDLLNQKGVDKRKLAGIDGRVVGDSGTDENDSGASLETECLLVKFQRTPRKLLLGLPVVDLFVVTISVILLMTPNILLLKLIVIYLQRRYYLYAAYTVTWMVVGLVVTGLYRFRRRSSKARHGKVAAVLCKLLRLISFTDPLFLAVTWLKEAEKKKGLKYHVKDRRKGQHNRHWLAQRVISANTYSVSQLKISPPENLNKTKKSWGERLKIVGNKTKEDERRAMQHHEQQKQLQQLHQHQQQRELANNNYLLHEYRNKYGTLSGGSALSKSMKYAEPWLYNSVRQPNPTPPRPNILVYQQPIPVIPSDIPRHNFQQTLIPHVAMCSCPEFIGGTMRSKKNTTASGICKKCNGSRMPWRGGGTLRATSVRLNPDNRMGGTVRVGQSHVRPSLMNVSPNFKAFTPDPYDLMRRNRLGGGGAEDETNSADVKQRGRRAKSTSPGRHNLRRSPSPVAKQPEGTRRARRDLCWENLEEDEDNTKRKSILECDVNPYQLIAKYLKNGERVEGNEGFASDNEDELSDDMGDNFLEDAKPVSIDVKMRKTEEKSPQKGVSIGGQRIRVLSSSAANDGEYVNDEETPVKGPVHVAVSMIPRLASPKRPQRRNKSLDGVSSKRPVVVVVRDDENESAPHTRGAETSSTNSQIERRSNLVSSNIKSILKKPSSPGAMDTSCGGGSGGAGSPPGCGNSGAVPAATGATFSDTIREADRPALQSPAEARSTTNSFADFYLPTFQEYRRENRKKKQVQFNVVQPPQCSDAVDSDMPVAMATENDAGDDNISDTVICDRRGEVAVAEGRGEEKDNVIEVTFKVSEPSRLRYFGDQIEDVLVHVSQPPTAERDRSGPSAGGMPPTVGHVWRDRRLMDGDMDETTTTRTLPIVTLRRSLSDRQLVSGDDGAGPTKQEQTAALFNDTMRLRLLSGRRTDSRQAFSYPGAASPDIDGDGDDVKTRRRVLSPGRNRPKEPPPPPPLPTTVHIHPQSREEAVKDIPPPEIESEIIIPEPDITTTTPKLVKFAATPQTVLVSKLENQKPTLNDFRKETEIVQNQPVVSSPVQEGAPPPPPQLPPRHIFPFTKKQIQTINNTKRTSPASTLLRGNARKARPNSCIPHIPTLTPNPDVSHNNSRIRHRNSDPGPAMTKVSLPPSGTSDVNDGVRTVVSVCPDSPDVHRLQIKTDVTRSRRTSILINGDCHEMNPHLKTSFQIDDKVENNNNKVTISVGGNDSGSWSVNSCIIDTSQGMHTNSLTRVNHTTNQITIPVSPEPVYNQRSNIQVDDQHVMIVDRTTGKSLGTQHDYEVLELLMDPVEAVRRHLVPHVCGKVNPDGGANLVTASTMDRLNSLFAEQQNGYSASSDTTGSIVEVSSPESSLSDTNRYSSALSSEKHSSDQENSDQENNGISVHYFTAPCLPHFVLGDGHGIGDEDKPDDIQSQKDIYDDAENIYESIKDPIYEEIGLPDTPPPLPLSPPPSLEDLDEKRTSRSIFEGASKYDILNYLVDAKERGYVESDYNSSNGDVIVEVSDGKPVELSPLGTLNTLANLSSRVSNLSSVSDSSEDSNLITAALDTKDGLARKSSADIERNDSGVGSETSKSSRSRWQTIPAGTIREDQIHLCEDCDQHVDTQVTDSGVMYAPLVCRKCGKKRAERKDTIAEIVETEEKYGGDLRIILEEFYRPMLVAGLLTSEQLSAIFLNVEELLENNAVLAEKLRDAHDIALEQGDEDLLTVNIGRLFLEAAPMLHAFESYCTRQGGASLLLANLEKEKELLRIFLRVSQMENAVLRRMNLNSFLMVPVQRVTKYPLLLARLHKVTPAHHEGRELLKQAQHKIELHLEHMNSVAKDISTTKLWRRISIVNGRRSSSEIDMINIKLRKMSVDVLEWNHDEVKFAMEGRMLYTNPTDNNWRKGRTIKLNPINALLVTNGKPTEDYRPEDELLLFPRKSGVREATLLLVKEKCGRYSLLRDPLYLDKCIVCCETDWEDYFEVQELASKDTFIFKAEDSERTKLWYRQLQYHSQGLGAWRRRRNALANIMINGMSRN